MIVDISKYEMSDAIPAQDDYPNTPWTHEVTLGQKYSPALDVADQESADVYLWMLVGHRLRYYKAPEVRNGHIVGWRPLKWREAFADEREAIAWRAFARDIGDFSLYSTVDGVTVERTKNRDHVWRMFKARLPERVIGNRDQDILERVHVQREKNAKRRGETYWRKSPQPEQQGLF